MPYENQTIYVDGEQYIKRDTRSLFPQQHEELRAQMIADMTKAIMDEHEANENVELPETTAAYLADSIWWRFVSLRPAQFEALVDILVRNDRFDASLVSMMLGMKLSDVRNAKNRVEKVIRAEAENTGETTDAA